eukprot:3204474-Rhodomonas_salina.1
MEYTVAGYGMGIQFQDTVLTHDFRMRYPLAGSACGSPPPLRPPRSSCSAPPSHMAADLGRRSAIAQNTYLDCRTNCKVSTRTRTGTPVPCTASAQPHAVAQQHLAVTTVDAHKQHPVSSPQPPVSQQTNRPQQHIALAVLLMPRALGINAEIQPRCRQTVWRVCALASGLGPDLHVAHDADEGADHKECDGEEQKRVDARVGVDQCRCKPAKREDLVLVHLDDVLKRRHHARLRVLERVCHVCLLLAQLPEHVCAISQLTDWRLCRATRLMV